MLTAERYHDISCGHRVVGHEGKCKHLHGHNYRIHFAIAGKETERVDKIGRVIDFSVIKNLFCDWLEKKYDHKMLIWSEDPLAPSLQEIDPEGVVIIPFNPTAENIADYLMYNISPGLLKDTGCHLVSIKVEETRKCSVTLKKSLL